MIIFYFHDGLPHAKKSILSIHNQQTSFHECAELTATVVPTGTIESA